MINNNQRKKENTALSEGSLEPRSSLDNATIDREKGTKDVDNHADVNNKMKDKPLSKEIVEWINPWGDKESAIPTRKVVEAVNRFMSKDWDLISSFLDREIGYIELAQKRKQLFDKIMGNFNNSPRKSMVDTEQRSKLSQPGSNPGEDTHIKKDKGCDICANCGKLKNMHAYTGRGLLCPTYDGKKFKPKCEEGLKEDKQ